MLTMQSYHGFFGLSSISYYAEGMKPTDPMGLLACAIATQEGWFETGTRPYLNGNPGDLRFAGQLNAADGIDGFAWFTSRAAGVAALYRQLWLQVAGGQTVRQIIAQWAPPSENNTSAYLQNVLAWTKLPADTPVLELLPPLVPLN